MSLSVIWTDYAIETFDLTLDFINENWGEKITQRFVRKTEKTIQHISYFPYSFRSSLQRTVRKAVISKQTSLFYEVHSTHITLLYFWDNRQQPLLDS